MLAMLNPAALNLSSRRDTAVVVGENPRPMLGCGHALGKLLEGLSVAFPFFGKKSTPPPSSPTGVAPRTNTRVRTDPLGPRTAGVAPAFQDSVPGRFGRRGLKNLPNPDAAGANSIYEVSNTGMHGLVPSVTELEGGPMTQAAFTQMPSELDLSAATRRPVPGAIEVPTPIENCVISHANGEAAEALRGLEAEIDQIGRAHV